MATRQKQSFEERVAEYVDSPLMAQRLRCAKVILAQIHGNFGVYRTQTRLSKKVMGECTCPSEVWPCKHIHALRATWEQNPDSFFDLDHWRMELSALSKARLIESIGEMVLRSPELLSVFGVPGFDDEAEDGEDFFGN
jgi:hypothetical protein